MRANRIASVSGLDTLGTHTHAHADGVGELAPLCRAEVDATIVAAPALAALIASRLLYRSAFELDAPQPVPTALQAGIAELALAARATELASAANSSAMAPVVNFTETPALAGALPDLGAQGLQFARALRLQFDGRTALQLVYLPDRGAPGALWLMPAASQPERALALDGQQALAWHAGGWAYVLIGALPLEQMQALRQRLPAALI